MHVVGAQAQVAVELEDLHAALALLGVAAQRFEVAGAALLGRFLGRALLPSPCPAPGGGGGCMPPGAPKPPGAICADADIARAPAPRRRRAGWCDAAGGDRSRVRPRVGPFAQLEQHAARSRRGAGTRPGGRARPGAASRRSAGRPPPSAWPARRSGRRPRSRRGAGPGPRFARKRVSAALPAGAQISTAASVSAAPRRVQERDVGRLPGDVFARARRQPEQSGQAVRGGVTIGDGDRDVVDSLDLDHGVDGRHGVARTGRNLYQRQLTWNARRHLPDDSMIVGCVLRPDTRSPGCPSGGACGCRMTALARLAGQLLSVGFDGTAAGDELRARIAALARSAA